MAIRQCILIQGEDSAESASIFRNSSVDGVGSTSNYAKAGFYIVLAVLGTIFSTVGICDNLGPTLQVWLAPKVYLLEYCARLAS